MGGRGQQLVPTLVARSTRLGRRRARDDERRCFQQKFQDNWAGFGLKYRISGIHLGDSGACPPSTEFRGPTDFEVASGRCESAAPNRAISWRSSTISIIVILIYAMRDGFLKSAEVPKSLCHIPLSGVLGPFGAS